MKHLNSAAEQAYRLGRECEERERQLQELLACERQWRGLGCINSFYYVECRKDKGETLIPSR